MSDEKEECVFMTEDGSCEYDEACEMQTGKYKDVCALYEAEEEKKCEEA